MLFACVLYLYNAGAGTVTSFNPELEALARISQSCKEYDVSFAKPSRLVNADFLHNAFASPNTFSKIPGNNALPRG